MGFNLEFAVWVRSFVKFCAVGPVNGIVGTVGSSWALLAEMVDHIVALDTDGTYGRSLA